MSNQSRRTNGHTGRGTPKITSGDDKREASSPSPKHCVPSKAPRRLRQARLTQLKNVTCLLLSLSALAAPTVAIPTNQSHGQSGPPATTASAPTPLTVEQARHFQSAFQTIADTAHVCILAEDAPIQRELPPDKVGDLVQSDSSVESLIGRVAAAYDYTVERAGRRGSAARQVFLLRKRFTQQNDLPDVTFEECRLAFSQIARFVPPFRPQPPTGSNTNTVLDVADALSEEQVRQMAQGGIPIRSLSPSQRELVWRLALHCYVALNTGYLEESGRYLDAVKKQGIVTQGFALEGHPYYLIWKGKPAYGIKLPSADPVQQFTPCCPVSETENLNSPGIEADAANSLGEVGDAKPAPGTQTLNAIVTDLSGHAKEGKFTVAPAVAARRVSRFGAAYASPAAQAEALAGLLDLRLQRRADDEFGLALPNVPDPRDVTELFACIRAAVPGPIRRFNGIALQPAPAPSAGSAPNGGAARRDHASIAGGIARLQMRPALVAALHDNKQKQVPFSALNERIRSRFAFYWFQEWLVSRLLDAPERTPEYISQFPDALLKGGWSGEAENREFEATILYRLPNGEVSYAGFTVGAKRFAN